MKNTNSTTHYSDAVNQICDILGPEASEEWVMDQERNSLVDTIVDVTSGTDQFMTAEEAVELVDGRHSW